MITTKFACQRATLLISLLLISKATLASAPIHIGHTTSLLNEVFARTADVVDEKRVQLNDKIFFKQQIITKDDANAVVTFRDGSTFVIAPKSVVILDEFIFNPAENVSEKSVTVLKGTLRYISGIAIKNAKTEIKTPFGTAGIRGSLVDVNANQGNATLTIAVGNGEATVTSPNGQSRQTFTPGQAGQSSNQGITQSSPQQTGQIAQFFQNTVGAPSSSNPGLTNQQATEDAAANNTPADTQKQTAASTKEVAVKPEDVKGPELSSPQETTITGDPQTIVTNYTQNSKEQNNLQSASATVKIVEAAIKDNPSAAAAITTAAVAANPTLAAVITTAAVTAAPNSAVAITTAAVTAAPKEAAAITTAAVTAAPKSAAAITTAAVTAAPKSAAAIATAAVTAAPKDAVAITKAAVTVAPGLVAAITSASTAAVAATPSDANTAVAIVSAAVGTLVQQNSQNPSTTSYTALATSVINNAVTQGVITSTEASTIITQLNLSNVVSPSSASPN